MYSCGRSQGYVAPSSSDSGTTGSLVYDYYWGKETLMRKS
jgi:hypothetical protein